MTAPAAYQTHQDEQDGTWTDSQYLLGQLESLVRRVVLVQQQYRFRDENNVRFQQGVEPDEGEPEVDRVRAVGLMSGMTDDLLPQPMANKSSYGNTYIVTLSNQKIECFSA